MSRYWSSVVHSLRPYVPGEQPAMAVVKLNANENPYGPSPRVIAALSAEIGEALRLYPDAGATRLRDTLARWHCLDREQIFAGNGSDEVLAHTFQALLKHDAPLLFPDITYSFFPSYCRLYGVDYREVPLDGSMRVRVADYRQACGAIILPNPNAPTGIALPRAEIEALVAEHPDQVVVIDEAYVDFGGESAVPLVRSYPNLLVVQTLSKSRALAGLRVGFAIGQRPLIEALERVKDSFNSFPLDRLALAGATAALEDEAWFEQNRERIIASRQGLATALLGLGFEVLPSATNFLFVRHPGRSGAKLVADLRSQAILVRHFAGERTADFLRISIGTDADNDRVIEALRRLVQ
jgi:histidinol-phosphate aminotransferase